MSNPLRPQLESLDDRAVPSATFDSPPGTDLPDAFIGLDVAAVQYPTDPHSPAVVSPVFALNFGEGGFGTLPALNGLVIAAVQYPTDPTSPIFFALAGGVVIDG